MAKQFLTSIDLTKNELQNAAIHNLGTAPSSPVVGQIFMNTTTGIPEYWNGSAWIPFGSGTLTSITAGTGLSGGTITTTGTIAVIFGTTAGTVAQGNDSRILNGQTAFGWGDHAAAGYLTSAVAATTYVPLARTITINGITQDLSVNRTWSVGTVTSVGLSLPSIFSVTGSPVTSSGTLTASLASQLANLVFASPNGASGAPTFRSLVAGDIPNLDASKITTGTLGVARGGTGATTLTGVVIGSGTSALTAIAGTAGQMLRRNSGNTAYEFFTPGTANTIATLDGSGKVPTSQLPDSILGQVKYQGTWNASTNTPTLASPPASTTKGDYYIVTVAGTQFGIDFNIGDWIISDGTSWSKVDNTDLITSVFGRTGAVVAVATDYNSFYVRHDTAAQGLNGTQQSNARTNIGAQATITGAATTITSSNLTINRALVSDASGKVAVSTVTSTELGYLSGVTSSIQTQLNGKFANPTGTTAQYLRGDGSLATFPTLISQAELNAGTVTTERLISAERVATWYATKTFAQTIGNGVATTFNIDHNLNSRDVVVQVYNATTYEDVEVDISRSTVNRVVIGFTIAPATSAYRVVVKI